MQVEKMIDTIQSILQEVGSKLLSMRSEGPIQGTWHETQLKSEADLIAEQIIVNGLRALTPSLSIVSEEDENSHAVDRLARYWLVDPIDGTASYCGGYSGFVTQIALMEGFRPVLSAVYAPAFDTMYLAERGAGASANGNLLCLEPKSSEVILTDNYPEPRGIANLLNHKLPCTGYLESGSIGLKICKVADGQANLFVKDVIVRDWDLAPGHLILHEAGGTLRDIKGCKINYRGGMEQSKGLIVATSESLLFRVSNFLEQEAKDV